MPDCGCPQHILALAYRALKVASIPGKGVTPLTKCEYFSPDVPPETRAYPQPGAWAVDEKFRKYFCVHKVKTVFPQVSAVFRGEQFFYPQLFPQAVHKHGAVVHSLSTGVVSGRLGACPAGGYRCWRSGGGCGNPVRLGPCPRKPRGLTPDLRLGSRHRAAELSVPTDRTGPIGTRRAGRHWHQGRWLTRRRRRLSAAAHNGGRQFCQ
ncbi:hypothetical protein NKCBBBOE_03890 [Pseudarthrobacter sp. MM222]|nr:hypothetical protein NKCBBBOE_03890 [Pseudarthrobacter sp. MM222]